MKTSEILHKRLSNGLEILCEHAPTVPVVALQAWVGVGSADELPREAGLAHLHEHMLFKGTARRGVGAVAREIEAAGGEINAWTSFDQTVYHVTMASRYFEAGLDVLSDAIQRSSFDAEELAREKEVVLEEIRRGDDQPARRLSQELFSTAYRKHPYGLPVIGTSKSVSSFERKDLLAFYKKWYVANNVVFVVCGDVEPVKAAAAVGKVFARFHSRPLRRPRRTHDRPPRKPRLFAEYVDAGDTYAALALPIPELTHSHIPGLDALSEILGGSEAARLFESVQAEKHLVSSVYAHAYTPKDPGLFMISAHPFAGKEIDAVSAIWDEVERLRRDGVKEEEFERAKLNLEAESVYLRQTVQGRARRLGYSLQMAGHLDFEDRYLEGLRRLSCRDIHGLARHYLAPERVSAGLFLPDGAMEKAAGKKKAAPKAAAALQKIFSTAAKTKRISAKTGAATRSLELHKLANGLRVVIERNDSVPLIAFKAACLGGSRFESEEDAGIYRFVAEMLPRGAGTKSASEIRHEVEAMAGAAEGSAGRNTTGVDVHCLSRYWDRGLSLFEDLLLAPTFPEDEIAKVRIETQAALDRERDSITQVLFRILRRELFGAHPYGFRLLGERETLEKFDAKALRRAHTRLLDPARMVVAVAGDVDPDRVLARMSERLSTLAAPPAPPPAPRMDELRQRHYVEEILERSQAHLAIGFRSTVLDAPNRYAFELANAVLAGQGGRLFTELRDKLSLAYSVSSFVVEGMEPGIFATYIGTAPEKLETAFEAMWRELARLREHGVSREELQRAKRHLIGAEAIDRQSCGARASVYALNELYGIGYRADEEYGRRISAVGQGEVRDLARRYITPEAAVLAVVRPNETPSLAAKWLGAGASGEDGPRASVPEAARAQPRRKSERR